MSLIEWTYLPVRHQQQFFRQKMQTEVIASIISAVIALVAVIASPFLVAYTSKRQIIAPMRHVWINDLRESLSIYISHLTINRWHGAPLANDSSHDYERKELEDIQRIKEATRIREKLLLLLSPKQNNHIALSNIIEDAFLIYSQGEDTSTILLNLRHESQLLIKSEWDEINNY